MDLSAKGEDGLPLIPENAHIRLAREGGDGEKILRRSFSLADGMDNRGQLDAGLFFVCFQRDPRKQFVPLQRRLGVNDLLNEYLSHTGTRSSPSHLAPTRAATSARCCSRTFRERRAARTRFV